MEQADQQDFRIPTRLGVDFGRNVRASGDEGSGYLGRLAPFPGVLPEVETPEEATSIRIAGLTPIETPESLSPRNTPESHVATSNSQISGNVQEKDDEEIAEGEAPMYVPDIYEQSDGVQSTDASRTGTPRSAIIDSDIDSDIMSDPRRKAPRKHLGIERWASSDGESAFDTSLKTHDHDSDVEADVVDSPRNIESGIEDNVMKAWRYSHGPGLMNSSRRKALEERQLPRTSK